MPTNRLLENPYMGLYMTFDPNNFYGAHTLVEFILRTATAKQTIAPIELLALPGMGKTTLLRYIWHPEGALQKYQSILQPPSQDKPEHVLPILAEFKLISSDVEPFVYLYEQFHRQYPESQVRQFAQQANTPDILADIMAAPLPENSADAIDLLEKAIKTLHRKKIRTIFLLDDFDLAFKQLDITEATRLRPLRDYAAFVMTMEQSLQRVNPTAAGSPFFQNTPLMRVGGLADNEARELIEAPAKKAEKPFSPQDVDFLIKQTGGHPYLAILGAKALWETREMMFPAGEQGSVLANGQEALLLGRLEEDFSGPFQSYWDRLEDAEKVTLTFLVREDQRQPLQRTHYKVLPVLLELGLVKYNAQIGGYEPFSPLFRHFLEDKIQQPPTDENLSGLEASLLEYLRAHSDRVCTYQELAEDVWKVPPYEANKEQTRRRMQVTVSRLRSKIEPSEDIISLREQGYRLTR